jgi:hypothetical protein
MRFPYFRSLEQGVAVAVADVPVRHRLVRLAALPERPGRLAIPTPHQAAAADSIMRRSVRSATS